MRILVIDDIRDFKIEENRGYEVVYARDGVIGLRLLRNETWDALYLDHDLGDGPTGYDVLREAASDQLLPDNIRLVTMNPVGGRNMANELLQLGYRELGFNLYSNERK